MMDPQLLGAFFRLIALPPGAVVDVTGLVTTAGGRRVGMRWHYDCAIGTLVFDPPAGTAWLDVFAGKKPAGGGGQGPIGPQGPQGIQGPAGPQGEPGSPGLPGLARTSSVDSATITTSPQTFLSVDVATGDEAIEVEIIAEGSILIADPDALGTVAVAYWIEVGGIQQAESDRTIGAGSAQSIAVIGSAKTSCVVSLTNNTTTTITLRAQGSDPGVVAATMEWTASRVMRVRYWGPSV